MLLQGCARDHAQLAVALVRLRHLPGVVDVELTNASKPLEEPQTPAAGGGTPAPGGGAPTEGSGDSCGQIKKHTALSFDATVTFKAQPGSDPAAAQPNKPKVPTSLGGGA
jgi:hypothetical protein